MILPLRRTLVRQEVRATGVTTIFIAQYFFSFEMFMATNVNEKNIKNLTRYEQR